MHIEEDQRRRAERRYGRCGEKELQEHWKESNEPAKPLGHEGQRNHSEE